MPARATGCPPFGYRLFASAWSWVMIVSSAMAARAEDAETHVTIDLQHATVADVVAAMSSVPNAPSVHGIDRARTANRIAELPISSFQVSKMPWLDVLEKLCVEASLLDDQDPTSGRFSLRPYASRREMPSAGAPGVRLRCAGTKLAHSIALADPPVTRSVKSYQFDLLSEPRAKVFAPSNQTPKLVFFGQDAEEIRSVRTLSTPSSRGVSISCSASPADAAMPPIARTSATIYYHVVEDAAAPLILRDVLNVAPGTTVESAEARLSLKRVALARDRGYEIVITAQLLNVPDDVRQHIGIARYPYVVTYIDAADNPLPSSTQISPAQSNYQIYSQLPIEAQPPGDRPKVDVTWSIPTKLRQESLVVEIDETQP